MRKDVRLGLAVGGVLFAVVLIYTVFFAGERKTLTSSTGDSEQQTSAGGSAEGTGGGAVPSPLVTQTPSAPSQAPPRSASDVSTGGGTGSRSAPTRGPAERREQAPSRADATAALADRGEGATVAAPEGPSSPAVSYNTPLSKWDWSTALATGAAPLPSREGEGGAHGAGESPQAAGGPGMGQPVGRAGRLASSTYVVRSGDSFWSIAQSAYGDANYMSHLTRANPRITPKNLKAGMILTIPPLEQVLPAGAPAASRQPAGEIDQNKQYRVRSGDSLSVISQKLYGSNKNVEEIYQLNRDLIGPNRSALKLNTVLKLPEPPTRAVSLVN